MSFCVHLIIPLLGNARSPSPAVRTSSDFTFDLFELQNEYTRSLRAFFKFHFFVLSYVF